MKVTIECAFIDLANNPPQDINLAKKIFCKDMNSQVGLEDCLNCFLPEITISEGA